MAKSLFRHAVSAGFGIEMKAVFRLDVSVDLNEIPEQALRLRLREGSRSFLFVINENYFHS